MKQDEYYTWQVVYEDGSQLSEYDQECPQGHGWADTTKNGLRAKALFLFPTHPPLLPHALLLPQNCQPLFFRRRSLTLQALDGSETVPRYTTHCIGWQSPPETLETTREEKSGDIYLFVGEDGSTLLTDDLQAV